MVGGYHIYYAYIMHEDTFYKKKNIFAFPLGTHLHKQTFMVTNDEMDTLIFCNFSTIYEDPMKTRNICKNANGRQHILNFVSK